MVFQPGLTTKVPDFPVVFNPPPAPPGLLKLDPPNPNILPRPPPPLFVGDEPFPFVPEFGLETELGFGTELGFETEFGFGTEFGFFLGLVSSTGVDWVDEEEPNMVLISRCPPVFVAID